MTPARVDLDQDVVVVLEVLHGWRDRPCAAAPPGCRGSALGTSRALVEHRRRRHQGRTGRAGRATVRPSPPDRAPRPSRGPPREQAVNSAASSSSSWGSYSPSGSSQADPPHRQRQARCRRRGRGSSRRNPASPANPKARARRRGTPFPLLVVVRGSSANSGGATSPRPRAAAARARDSISAGKSASRAQGVVVPAGAGPGRPSAQAPPRRQRLGGRPGPWSATARLPDDRPWNTSPRVTPNVVSPPVSAGRDPALRASWTPMWRRDALHLGHGGPAKLEDLAVAGPSAGRPGATTLRRPLPDPLGHRPAEPGPGSPGGPSPLPSSTLGLGAGRLGAL